MDEWSYDEYSDQAGLRRAGQGGRNADPCGPALAARSDEGEGEDRSLAKGRGAEHGTSIVVCARSRQVDGVSVALPGGTERERRTGLTLKTRGGERYCHVSVWRQRSAAQRSGGPAETAHGEMNSLFTRIDGCRDGHSKVGAATASNSSL